MTLDDLPFPFHAASDASVFADMDLSFSYHAHIQDGKVRALCNDISCTVCPFSCKDGKDRQAVLAEFAISQFPELLI